MQPLFVALTALNYLSIVLGRFKFFVSYADSVGEFSPVKNLSELSSDGAPLLVCKFVK